MFPSELTMTQALPDHDQDNESVGPGDHVIMSNCMHTLHYTLTSSKSKASIPPLVWNYVYNAPMV
jgi:hypothetical protein